MSKCKKEIIKNITISFLVMVVTLLTSFTLLNLCGVKREAKVTKDEYNSVQQKVIDLKNELDSINNDEIKAEKEKEIEELNSIINSKNKKLKEAKDKNNELKAKL